MTSGRGARAGYSENAAGLQSMAPSDSGGTSARRGLVAARCPLRAETGSLPDVRACSLGANSSVEAVVRQTSSWLLVRTTSGSAPPRLPDGSIPGRAAVSPVVAGLPLSDKRSHAVAIDDPAGRRATRPRRRAPRRACLAPLCAGRQQTFGLPLRHERERTDRPAGECRVRRGPVVVARCADGCFAPAVRELMHATRTPCWSEYCSARRSSRGAGESTCLLRCARGASASGTHGTPGHRSNSS